MDRKDLLGSEHARHWEWFIEILDHQRIRQTLIQFPIWDKLEPHPICKVEVSVESDEIQNVSIPPEDHIVEQNMEEEDDEDDQSTDMSLTESSSSRQLSKPGSASNHKTDCWHGKSPDRRYSPAFILPLVLGSMEAFQINQLSDKDVHMDASGFKAGKVSNNETDMDETEDVEKAHRQTFVKIVRRLSDKGCISLAFASLSSKCPALRKIAVATLCLFLQAMHTKEAHELLSWRERPQLAMIIDSVQRGLTVRRAIKASRRSEEVGQSNERDAFTLLPILQLCQPSSLRRQPSFSLGQVMTCLVP